VGGPGPAYDAGYLDVEAIAGRSRGCLEHDQRLDRVRRHSQPEHYERLTIREVTSRRTGDETARMADDVA